LIKNFTTDEIDESYIHEDDSMNVAPSIKCLSTEVMNDKENFQSKLDDWRKSYMTNGEHINKKQSMDLLGREIPHQQKYSATSRNRKDWLKRTKDGNFVCIICKTRTPLALRPKGYFFLDHFEF